MKMIPIKSTPPGNIRDAFQTLEEIREYVSGHRIQCLVCGKYYRRLLYKHLETHQMTHDEYRETFGIPWSTSLTSATSREATSSKMTPERIALFKQCRKVRGTSRRPAVPAVRNQWQKDAESGRYFARQLVTT